MLKKRRVTRKVEKKNKRGFACKFVLAKRDPLDSSHHLIQISPTSLPMRNTGRTGLQLHRQRIRRQAEERVRSSGMRPQRLFPRKARRKRIPLPKIRKHPRRERRLGWQRQRLVQPLRVAQSLEGQARRRRRDPSHRRRKVQARRQCLAISRSNSILIDGVVSGIQEFGH